MKRIFNFLAKRILPALWMVLTLWAVNAWAADGFEFTRQTYDLIMRWVNFIILAVVIIKYARRPIANFLQEKKEAVEITIERLEDQKKAAKEQLAECREQLAASEERVNRIKEKIVAQGEARKAELIAAAQNESRMMMQTAQLRIAYHIRQTHDRIKSELVDTATQIAAAKLPGLLTKEDEDHLIDKWMEAVRD